MAHNVKTPAGANGRGSGRDVVASQADVLPVAPSSVEIQMRRLRARYGFSYERAAVEASHCYGVAEDWRTRA